MINGRLHDQLARLLAADEPATAKAIVRLRERHGEALTALLLASASLQRKACDKFGEGLWWVTARALEQSTAWQVARLKASWFGDEPVVDLCCGLGGDSVWLARRGPLVGIDSDPAMVGLAAANVSQTVDGTVQAGFVCDDAIRQANSLARVAVHVDPDRRPSARRTSAPDRYAPAWSELVGVVVRAPSAIVKLAPAAEIDPASLGRPTHRCWTSLRGSVREQSLLAGEAIERAGASGHERSAVVVRRDGSSIRYCGDSGAERAAVAAKPGGWMIDPDPAIRAAGMTDAFAISHGLSVIGSPSGFLTADAATAESPLATYERTEWVGSSDERVLKREMRLHDVYPARVKARGVDRDPAKLIKRLRNCGQRPVTLWLGRVGERVYCAWTTCVVKD